MRQLKAIHDLFHFEDDLFRNEAEIFQNEPCTGIGQNSAWFFKIEYKVGDSGPCMVTCVCARCCGMVLPRDAPDKKTAVKWHHFLCARLQWALFFNQNTL